MSNRDSTQIVVVGAGVVGLAVARALAESHGEVLVLEAHSNFGMEVSSRNSEVIHAGLYYPTGSLKARACVRGRELLYAYAARRGIEARRIGKLIVASSEAEFGDCIVEVEFLVGKSTPGSSIDSNSGVKMMNIYEIQIFDSYGVTNLSKTDCGAIYSETPPAVNACKPPGEWQKLVIDFRAPRFDESGQKIANAKFVKVTLNGQVVQDNVEIAHGTNVSRKAPEHPTGPIYLQGDHGAVAFRNLIVTPQAP